MARANQKVKQQEMELRTWGGRRRGAGRKPKGKKAGVSHVKRERLPRSYPAHITLKVALDIWNLRGKRMMQEIRAVFWQARGVAGMRLTQFSIQQNHIHLIVEAEEHEALSKGMKSLCVRLAARINRRMRRRGQVFVDRFHMHVLRTPREVEHAIRYVRNNSRLHAEREGRFWRQAIDPCTGGPCRKQFPPENLCLVVEPRTWLLRKAWGLPKLEPMLEAFAPEPMELPWGERQAWRDSAVNLELAFE